MVISRQEGLLHINGVGDSFAEAVSGKRHGERSLLVRLSDRSCCGTGLPRIHAAFPVCHMLRVDNLGIPALKINCQNLRSHGLLILQNEMD